MFRSFDSDAYAFTAIGSGATASTQNGLNQHITIGGASATWDSKGNLHFDPATSKSYCYSSENLLTGTGATCSPPTTTLAYDPAMRLYQVAGAAMTRFAYTGADAIADYDGANALQHRYVLDPSTGQPLVQYDGSGTTTRKFLSTDERGSVISQTDTSGALIGINTYDEYGRPGAANLGRYQYTGQKWIGEAGLYDYKSRDYLPHLGIFAQTDPIGYGGGPNLYAYVLGDPINLVDPFGLEDITITHAGCHGGTFHDGRCIPNVGPGITPPTNVGTPIVVTGHRRAIVVTAAALNQNLLNRIYRVFVPDPCTGKGTDEGAGNSGYEPYDLSPAALEAGVELALAKHGLGAGGSEFNSFFSNPQNLSVGILAAIQTNPLYQPGRGFRYTVDMGQIVGYDSRNGGTTNYLTVTVKVEGGTGTVTTAYPGCI